MRAQQPVSRAERWLVALAVFASFIQLTQWGIVRPLMWPGVDYGKHWEAARAVLEGRNNYVGGELWMGFNYPQATAFMFVWLGWLSRSAGEIVWKVFNLVLVLLTGWLGWRFFKPERVALGSGLVLREALLRNWWLVVLAVTAFYFPLVTSLYVGNIDPVNALLAVGLTAALLRGRGRFCGVLWALATLIKMMPLLLLGPVLRWRRWNVLAAFCAVMACYFVLLLLTGRVQYEWFFVREVIPKIPFYWLHVSVSPLRALATAMGWQHALTDERAFTRMLHVYEALGLLAWIAVVEILHRRGGTALDAFELTLLFIPALSPLLENHHFVWILPVLLLQLRRAVEHGMGRLVLIALAVGWLLVSFGFCIAFQFAGARGWPNYVSTAGYLIVLGVSLPGLLRKRNPVEQTS